jgi:polysaccharide export outer membrane protein
LQNNRLASPLPAFTAIALGSMLAACSLPAAAPTSAELTNTRKESSFQFALVNVDSRVTNILARQNYSFGQFFQKSARYTPRNSLRAGDTVAITIYETGGSSLFPPPSSSGANLINASLSSSGASPTTTTSAASSNTIPAQVIEADGTIGVPFAGRLKVVGMTPSQVSALIERELNHKAVAPQVVVTPVSNLSTSVTVSGDVNSPRVVPLTLRGERVLDVVAAAGGAKFPAYETYVHMVRGGHSGTMLLQKLVEEPVENVMIHPNDQVYLVRNPRTFVVLGATLRPAVFPFDREKISLAEAVAQAGGPIDMIGDPGGIYLFRQEPWSLASQVMNEKDLAVFGAYPQQFVPVLYRIGLRDAEGYFLSQSIQMRDKDVLLIANADATQLQKMLNLVRGVTGIAYDLKRNSR